MPRAASSVSCGLEPQIGEQPRVDRGCSVRTRPSSDLGEAGHLGDFGHGDTRLADRRRRRPGRHDLDAGSASAFASSASPVLSLTDTSARWIGIASRSRYSFRVDGRAALRKLLQVQSSFGEVAHDLLQQAALHRLDALVQARLRCRPAPSGTRSCAITGPLSTPWSTTMTLAPVSVAPAASASRTACAPGNSGRYAGWVLMRFGASASTTLAGSSRMNPLRMTRSGSHCRIWVEELVAPDVAVRETAQHHREGRDAELFRVLEPVGGTVGPDRNHARRELGVLAGLEQSPQPAAPARDEDDELQHSPALHRRASAVRGRREAAARPRHAPTAISSAAKAPTTHGAGADLREAPRPGRTARRPGEDAEGHAADEARAQPHGQQPRTADAGRAHPRREHHGHEECSRDGRYEPHEPERRVAIRQSPEHRDRRTRPSCVPSGLTLEPTPIAKPGRPASSQSTPPGRAAGRAARG